MEDTFEEISTHSADHMSMAGAPRTVGLWTRKSVSSSTSSADIDYLPSPANAAIGEEQAEIQKRSLELTRRSIELEALFFDDYGVQLDRSSRLAFECFMKYSPMVGMPLLGAESNGKLQATWVKGEECLSLRFRDRYHLDFAVTYIDGNVARRDWGRSSLVSIFSECPQAKRLASI